MRRNLFLYLALACLASIIAIFIIDGYMGIYDTIYITTREYEQKITPDYWQRTSRYDFGPFIIGAVWDEPVLFRYEITNHRFSTYSATVDVSVWKSGEKVLDLLSENISASAFDEVSVGWTLSAGELESAGPGFDDYTVKIKWGEIEREVVVNFYRLDKDLLPRPAK